MISASARYTLVYGSLASLIILMLWLHLMGTIILAVSYTHLLGEDEVIGEQGGFRQQLAVFGDEIMPGKDHIGGGLSPAGIGIKVCLLYTSRCV